MSAAEVVMLVLAAALALAVFIAALAADEVYRLRRALLSSAHEPITLDAAVAVVIDTLATGEDDHLDGVRIDREDEPGEYRVFAYVHHADGSTTARGRHVYVPDDLDAPIGVRPAAVTPFVPPAAPTGPAGPRRSSSVTGLASLRDGAARSTVGARPRGAAPHAGDDLVSRIGQYSGAARQLAQEALALLGDDPREGVEPAPEVLDGLSQHADRVSLVRPGVGVRGPGVVDGPLGVAPSGAGRGHDASPSVRTVPAPTGPVVGAAALGTPPADAPTVGDPTDTDQVSSAGVVPVDGPDGGASSSPSGAADEAGAR